MSDSKRASAIAILADNIKVRRVHLHESQQEFARRCGLTQKQVSAIERQVANPTLETLDTISRSLEIPHHILLRPLR